jgi:copper chaperone
MATVTLHIDGMSCGHCLRAVQQALTGVAGAAVETMQMGRAVIQTTADGPTGELLAGLVTTAGYPTTATVVDAHHD